MPAEGVLQYQIIDVADVSIDKRVAVIVITDGFIAKKIETPIPDNVDVKKISDAQLNFLWNRADVVPMKVYRRAGHRASGQLFDDATDAMYQVVQATAEPLMADVLAAAATVLAGSRKQLEWDKLTAMLQSASEDDRHKFMALVALIALSRG